MSDSGGATRVASTTISADDSPPVAVIDAPLASYAWSVGDVIPFAGHAIDPETGPLPPERLSWSLLVHHCAGLQVRPLALLRACVPAMLAAALMVAVVLMLGAILSASGVAPLVSLVAQVLGGGLTYITAFVLLAPDLVADLRDRLRPGSQHR